MKNLTFESGIAVKKRAEIYYNKESIPLLTKIGKKNVSFILTCLTQFFEISFTFTNIIEY